MQGGALAALMLIAVSAATLRLSITGLLSHWRNCISFSAGPKSLFHNLFINFGSKMLCSEGHAQSKRPVVTIRIRSRYPESLIFVADYEVGEVATWSSAALAKTA